jgi:hypothetical protein
MEEFLEVAPRFSLKTMGLLDEPSAPLSGVNGKLDDQAPVDDIYLLMEHGNRSRRASIRTAITWAARQASRRITSRPRSLRG